MKYTIKYNGFDTNIKIGLNDIRKPIGEQQHIDELVNETKQKLINPINDVEVRRFVYNNTNAQSYGYGYNVSQNSINTIKFYFYKNNIYGNTFTNAGFTTDELNQNSIAVKKSFYIMELFDTYDSYTQNKITTNYVTKIIGIDKNPIHEFNPSLNTQFNDLFIPISFLEKNNNTTIIVSYLRFNFYNAKTGKLSVFYNYSKRSLLTSEKLYFKVLLNTSTKTWQFFDTNLFAYEILPTSKYVERANDSVNDLEIKKQNYPDKKAFDYNSNDYIDVE